MVLEEDDTALRGLSYAQGGLLLAEKVAQLAANDPELTELLLMGTTTAPATQPGHR